MTSDIGIDLGTTKVMVYIDNQGIVLTEPSVVAVNTRSGDVLAVGEEAFKMIGRTRITSAPFSRLKTGLSPTMK